MNDYASRPIVLNESQDGTMPAVLLTENSGSTRYTSGLGGDRFDQQPGIQSMGAIGDGRSQASSPLGFPQRRLSYGASEWSVTDKDRDVLSSFGPSSFALPSTKHIEPSSGGNSPQADHILRRNSSKSTDSSRDRVTSSGSIEEERNASPLSIADANVASRLALLEHNVTHLTNAVGALAGSIKDVRAALDASSGAESLQIQALTSQVQALSATLSHLLKGGAPAGAGYGYLGPGPMLSPSPSPAYVPRGGMPNLEDEIMRAGMNGDLMRASLSASPRGLAKKPPKLPPSPMGRSLSAEGAMRPPPFTLPKADPATGNPPGSLGSKWEALGISPELFRVIAKYGLGPPTKVQTRAIPCIVHHQDVVAQAPAIQERIQNYVIPTLQLLLAAGAPTGALQAVVVTATVDQAAQAQRLANGLGASFGIRTCLAAGRGRSPEETLADAQSLLTQAPHILIGTPQKLLELCETRTISLRDVQILVVDECDQILARNLSDFVLALAKLLPPGKGATPPSPALGTNGPTNDSIRRQTAIFSCTVPQDVLAFSNQLHLKDAVRVLVRRELQNGTRDNSKHNVITINGNGRRS